MLLLIGMKLLQLAEVEPLDDEHELEIEMITELPVPSKARIKTLVDAQTHWLLLDESGRLLRVALPATGPITSACVSFDTLLTFHGGGITAIVPDGGSHDAVSSSMDGTIWAQSLDGKGAYAVHQFSTGVTCLVSCKSSKPGAPAFLIGHSQGFFRRAVRCLDGWCVTHTSKPHSANVIAVCTSPLGCDLATIAADGTLFFFRNQDGVITPHAFTSVDRSLVAALWLGNEVVVGSADGTLLRVTPPVEHDHVARGTYRYAPTLQQQVLHFPPVQKLGSGNVDSSSKESPESTKPAGVLGT
jgi:hypothetical protein